MLIFLDGSIIIFLKDKIICQIRKEILMHLTQEYKKMLATEETISILQEMVQIPSINVQEEDNGL